MKNNNVEFWFVLEGSLNDRVLEMKGDISLIPSVKEIIEVCSKGNDTYTTYKVLKVRKLYSVDGVFVEVVVGK
ncbi:MAG: hypothetical protein ACRDD7_06135 [Peptostreptococcaceae bacterium]